MLSHNAFESGVLFQQTLLQDELPLRRQACADFWRRHCYPLSADLAEAVSQLWSGPEALLAELQPYLSGEMPLLRPAPDAQETLAQRHQVLLARIERVKATWREHEHQVVGLIAASGVDKRSYSSRYLPKWLDEMSVWAQAESRDYQLPSAIARFAQATLLEKTSKGSRRAIACSRRLSRCWPSRCRCAISCWRGRSVKSVTACSWRSAAGPSWALTTC